MGVKDALAEKTENKGAVIHGKPFTPVQRMKIR